MTPQDAWQATYNQLELQLARATFDTWIRPAVFLRCEADVFVIGAHNSYARDMLQHRLYRNIHRVLSDVRGEHTELAFEIHKPEPPPENDPAEEEMPLFRLLAQQQTYYDDTSVPASSSSLGDSISPPRHADLPESELNPRFTFERFMVNQSNQVVYEAARAVAEYPATVYNPFLVYGGVGLGKTHLLQAIAHICVARGMRVVYIPSEAFTNDLVKAIRHRTTAMFREKYRHADMLLVDDIQFISGKETTQEEFFHTFNALVNFNKQIVLASDRHPRELATLEDRLRSRFQGGLVADIQPPELETRLAILDLWLNEKDVALPRDVLAMVAQRAPRNVRELEGIFNQVVAQSHLGRGEITLPQAESTVTRYRRPTQQLTPLTVIEGVARHHGLTADELIGKRRTGRINHARQIAMFLARQITEASLPQIGDAFGGRSHTTVLHGANKIADELEVDQNLANKIAKLRRAIERDL